MKIRDHFSDNLGPNIAHLSNNPEKILTIYGLAILSFIISYTCRCNLLLLIYNLMATVNPTPKNQLLLDTTFSVKWNFLIFERPHDVKGQSCVWNLCILAAIGSFWICMSIFIIIFIFYFIFCFFFSLALLLLGHFVESSRLLNQTHLQRFWKIPPQNILHSWLKNCLFFCIYCLKQQNLTQILG